MLFRLASLAVAVVVLAIGVFGALVGSFLNVVIHRLPRGESLAFPRSRCPSCGVAIAPYDNVPVVSWLLLRGRCRSCGRPVSPRYPLVEGLTAVVFALVAAARGMNLDLAFELPFAAMLIAVAGIDLEHHIVPNRIVAPATAFGLAAAVLLRSGDLFVLLFAGTAAFVFLLVTALAYPAGMGMGDVKLAGVMGLFLGLSVIPALFIAFVLGSAVGLAMMARHGVSARKRGVPFAPFLAAGGLAALLGGPDFIDLYVRTFLS